MHASCRDRRCQNSAQQASRFYIHLIMDHVSVKVVTTAHFNKSTSTANIALNNYFALCRRKIIAKNAHTVSSHLESQETRKVRQ